MAQERVEDQTLETEGKLLAGKRVLVTGAGRDIGAEISEVAAMQGAHVVGNYRGDPKRIIRLSDRVNGSGGTFNIVRADITDPLERERLIKAAGGKLDSHRLDALVLNASGPSREVNVDASLSLIDLAKPVMSDGGVIVHIQSFPGLLYGDYDTSLLLPEYQTVAQYKKEAGEALEGRREELRAEGIELVTVCPPEVPDTITWRTFKKLDPDISDKHRLLVDMEGRTLREMHPGVEYNLLYQVRKADVAAAVCNIIAGNIPESGTHFFIN